MLVSEMAVADGLTLVETVAHRLCHDLSGLVGTLMGTLELAEEEADGTEALAVAGDAARTLGGRLGRLRPGRGGMGPLPGARQWRAPPPRPWPIRGRAGCCWPGASPKRTGSVSRGATEAGTGLPCWLSAPDCGQPIAPRAATGHTHSTRSPRTHTYQSCRSTVGSQWPGTRRSLSPHRSASPGPNDSAPCSSEAPAYSMPGRPCTRGRPESVATALCPASTTARPFPAALITVASTNRDCRNGLHMAPSSSRLRL